MHILDEMEKAISTPREELSQYAPRIITVKINPSKIGEIIGPKGKTIRGIQEATGATINVEDDGTVTISIVSGGEGGERARKMIQGMTEEPEVGRIYEGVVKSTTSFGAFVEILPGTEGLVPHLGAAGRAYREDGGRGQEGRDHAGEAALDRREGAAAALAQGGARGDGGEGRRVIAGSECFRGPVPRSTRVAGAGVPYWCARPGLFVTGRRRRPQCCGTVAACRHRAGGTLSFSNFYVR